MEIKIAGKFRIGKKLGKGGYGVIYSGTNTKTNDEVAIKLEKTDAEPQMLQYEAKIYEKISGNVGIPQTMYFGVEGHFNVLVMELLGPSIENLF